MNTTTLRDIRGCTPCYEGWKTLLLSLHKTKEDEDPIALSYILTSNGLEDAAWCLRASDVTENQIRLFMVALAKRVLHLAENPAAERILLEAEAYANRPAGSSNVLPSFAIYSHTPADTAVHRTLVEVSRWQPFSYYAWRQVLYVSHAIADSLAKSGTPEWEAAYKAEQLSQSELFLQFFG